MNTEIKKAELLGKYNNWIKKNKQRLIVVIIVYIVIILMNLFLLKNNRITIFSSLLIFTYILYVSSLIWFINNKLIKKIDSIDFKTK